MKMIAFPHKILPTESWILANGFNQVNYFFKPALKVIKVQTTFKRLKQLSWIKNTVGKEIDNKNTFLLNNYTFLTRNLSYF